MKPEITKDLKKIEKCITSMKSELVQIENLVKCGYEMSITEFDKHINKINDKTSLVDIDFTVIKYIVTQLMLVYGVNIDGS